MLSDEFEKLVVDVQGALEAGEHVKALALLDQLQAADSNNGRLHELRARTLLALNDDEAASVEAEHAVELEPDSTSAMLLLAETSWRLKRVNVAQTQFERAIQLSQRDPSVLTRYAAFMAQERGPRPAELAAREALQANDRSAEAWAALGLAQHRMHQRNPAQASLKKALEIDPNSAFAQAVQVILLRSRHETEKAAALVNVMQDDPGNVEFVDAMRKGLNRERAFQKLMERPQVQERMFRPLTMPHVVVGRIVALTLMAGVLAGGVYLCRERGSLVPLGPSVALAIFVWLRVRRMFR